MLDIVTLKTVLMLMFVIYVFVFSVEPNRCPESIRQFHNSRYWRIKFLSRIAHSFPLVGFDERIVRPIARVTSIITALVR